MKMLLKKFAALKTISSKISTYLHEIDADPQEDDLDFEDEEWMDYPVKPTLAHVILDLLLSPTYRLPRTVTAVRIYRDENIFSVCPKCDVCIEREYQGYCHRCGQYLDWSKLEDVEEIFIGLTFSLRHIIMMYATSTPIHPPIVLPNTSSNSAMPSPVIY